MATSDEISEGQKALVVAMELLRNAVQDNVLALAANTRRTEESLAAHGASIEAFVAGAGGGAGGAMPTATPVATVVETAEQRQKRQERAEERKRANERAETLKNTRQAFSPLTSMFALMGAKFAAIAGPLAVLGQVLSSATSGLQTLGKAAQLVASAFGPIILPAALMLATSFTAVAELMSDVGGPAMDAFFDLVINTLVPAITSSIDAFILLANITNEAADVLKALGGAAGSASAFLHGRGSRDARERVGGSMRDVMESFRRSLGPKAQISGLGEVGKSVQLAALNADPLEARLLRQQLMVLERIAAAVERRREADASGRVHDPVSAAGAFALGALASSPLAAGLGALFGGRR